VHVEPILVLTCIPLCKQWHSYPKVSHRVDNLHGDGCLLTSLSTVVGASGLGGEHQGSNDVCGVVPSTSTTALCGVSHLFFVICG
jgi:hypothetical protein